MSRSNTMINVSVISTTSSKWTITEILERYVKVTNSPSDVFLYYVNLLKALFLRTVFGEK